MIILGINEYHPDAAAAIIIDGKLIAAAEEERFNRIKHAAGFPAQAIQYCLKESGVSITKVDYIALPRYPTARLFKKMHYGLKIPRLLARRIFAARISLSIKKIISDNFQIDEKAIKAKIINVEHHRAHIASAFFVSDFDRSLLFSADGLGDFASTMWGIGEGNKIKIISEVAFPHSLGLYYSAITQHLGFLDYGDEYKVMGLAAFGHPEYKREFEKIIFQKENLGFRLGLECFLHHKKLVDIHFEDGYPKSEILYSSCLEELIGAHRDDFALLESRHENIAASLQNRLEEIFFYLLNGIANLKKDCNKLCLSGGVAFNCAANGKIFDSTPFKEAYIQPAAGDAGLAIGAAYYVWNQLLGNPRSFAMNHAYWGPGYDKDGIAQELNMASKELQDKGYVIERVTTDEELCSRVAKFIAEGKIVGWFQGRMEWGPRALGNRSILADPRRQDVKDIINEKIKIREAFRPFAPSILEERVGEYFEKTHPSPFMLFAYKVKPEKRGLIPAVIHIDGTGRLQSVSHKTNPLFWRLIKEFEKLTGVPVLLNTSFNENEPIVCKPKEALDCFLRTGIDVLTMGRHIIRKKDGRVL
jgi:carbamoyltransferase